MDEGGKGREGSRWVAAAAARGAVERRKEIRLRGSPSKSAAPRKPKHAFGSARHAASRPVGARPSTIDLSAASAAAERPGVARGSAGKEERTKELRPAADMAFFRGARRLRNLEL